MFPIRIKACSESDLRMLGDLARNIQRVLPVTQADIDAAAALGKGWVVWKVIEVNDPIDNLRGGTQLVIKQNSITPGQNVRRVLIVQGPGGKTVVIGPGPSPLLLPDAIADSLTYVKAFGGTEQRNLPDNYIERQFIYMMDGSYLLTDIVPTSDMRIELDIQTTSITSDGHAWLGARNGSAGSGLCVGSDGTKKLFFDGCSGTRYTSSTVATNNTRYKYTWNNGVATIESGGSVVATNTFTPSDTITVPLVINGLNSSGSVILNNNGIYCYGLKIWNAQGELVADYVPAVQKGTVPVVGFYDTVSKTFKTATAGTFAAGGEAVPTPDAPMDIISNNGVLKARHQSGLPLGYTLLDYVETDGNSYIDTNLLLSNTSEFEITFQSADATLNTPVMGAISGGTSFTSTDNLCVTYTVASGLNAYSVYCNGAAGDANESWNAGDAQDRLKHTVKYNGLNIAPTLDGVDMEQLVSTTLVANTPTVTTWLFGRNNTGSGTKTQTGVRIYDFNVVGIAHFVPCKNASNVIGMYDTVNGVFYQNAGTGDFVAGPAVSDPVEIYTDGTVETIKDSLNNTATAEMLLKVGDYTDVQEILSGAVTRNVGVKVLDGTEDWVAYNGGEYFPLGEGGSLPATTVAYCSHFKYAGAGVLIANLPENNFTVATNGNCSFKSSDTATKADWVAWLADQYAAGTPVIVVYPLATPTTESVAGQTLQVTSGDNTLEITQASLSGLELEAEYTKAA